MYVINIQAFTYMDKYVRTFNATYQEIDLRNNNTPLAFKTGPGVYWHYSAEPPSIHSSIHVHTYIRI